MEINQTTEDLYNALKMGNAVSNQQANDLIRLSITARITTAIADSEDPKKIKELMDILKDMDQA